MSFFGPDCRLRYVNYTLFIIFMSAAVIFLIIIQSEILSVTKVYKPDFGESKVVFNQWFIQWSKTPPDKISYYQLNTERILHTTNKRFLSFSIDSSQVHHGFLNPTLRNPTLIKTVSHLSGGYLRLGGRAADQIIFRPSHRAWPKKYLPLDGGLCVYENKSCPTTKPSIQMFSMCAADWIAINEFSNITGLKLLFDLNVLLRNNDTWNPTNAEELLDFSFSQLYNLDWELGNEPNSFKHLFGIEVPPANLAADFKALRRLLQRYTSYSRSVLIGPSVGMPRDLERPINYLREFLSSDPEIDAVTWHHYYLGPLATLEDFLNPVTYKSFVHKCREINELVESQKVNKPLWLGETGSAYGGGVPNMSDRFVASFLWTDKLGSSAKQGISLVVRQSLYRGHYSLLDELTLEPNPDFWVSVLHKKLVGHKVLKISFIGEVEDETLRIYAHCSQRNKVIIFGVNLANSTHGISLAMNISASFFSLSGSPSLLSKTVSLNGENLVLRGDKSLPPMEYIPVSMIDPVSIPPQSIFFLELDLNLTICSNS